MKSEGTACMTLAAIKEETVLLLEKYFKNIYRIVLELT